MEFQQVSIKGQTTAPHRPMFTKSWLYSLKPGTVFKDRDHYAYMIVEPYNSTGEDRSVVLLHDGEKPRGEVMTISVFLDSLSAGTPEPVMLELSNP